MKFKLILIILIVTFKTTLASNIDVQHISLELKFDWGKKQAYGNSNISLFPKSNLNQLYLDAGMLEIKDISIKNKKLSYTYKSNESDSLLIFLDHTYSPEELINLQIEYHTNYINNSDPNAIWGSFGKGLRFMHPTSTTPKKRKQIWSSGEPNNNKYWFPCHEDIADIHTMEFNIEIEEPFMALCNGKLIEIINNNNTKTFHYKTESAISNYLAFIVIGEYIDIAYQHNKTTIHNFGYKNESDAIKATTELLPDMMTFLEEKTNFKYPYEYYSQIVVQDYPFPGLTGQNSASIISDNYIDDKGVHADYKYLWDGIAMQALANQWFGNLLMPSSWKDIWLNNAFAQYFAGLYTEKTNSKSEYLTYINTFEKSNVIGDWNANYKHPIVTDNFLELENYNCDNYNKFKGALVLRMLQKEIGDDNWWKAIQLYVNENAYKQINTSTFQQSIEKITRKSYQWFFDEWIYKNGLPEFEISKKFNSKNRELEIVIKQIQDSSKQDSPSDVKYFQGKFEIEIDKKIIPLEIVPKQENVFKLKYSKAPSFVNFNYEKTFLCEIKVSRETNELLHIVGRSKDVLAKQEELDELVLQYKDTITADSEKQKILKLVKSEIKSDQYWRYRLYALGIFKKLINNSLNKIDIAFVKKLIHNEKSWLKASAISLLGNTNDKSYAPIFFEALSNESDRVINAAAIAIGKSKHPDAFKILMNLENNHSWKNQNRISAINGLEQLADTNAIEYITRCLLDNASERWYLATPIWDYPYAAAIALSKFGKGNLVNKYMIDQLKISLIENDLNDIFQNLQLINILNIEDAKEAYQLMKTKFTNDKKMLEIINNYEQEFLNQTKQ